MEKPPSFRYRRIGMELRRIREERGLTLQAASALLDRSTGSISGIENGQRIRVRDLAYILYRYEADEAAFTEAMLELAREGHKAGWWHRHAGALSPAEMDFISLESDARTIRTYEIIAIPGLLQTKAYARALIDTAQAATWEAAIEIRMTRQQVLTRPKPPQLSAVVTEAALRQLIGGADVMREQLERLLAESERENIDLRVIPYAAGAHVGFAGSFTIMEIGQRGKLTVVVIETPERMVYVENDGEVRRLVDRFARLHETALSEPDSRALVKQVLSEL